MSKKKKTIEELLEEAILSDEEQSYEVPRNWVWTRVENAIKPMETREPKKLDGKSFHYIDVDAIDNKKQMVRQIKEVEITLAPSRAKRKVSKDDVIISLVRPYLKNIAHIDIEDNKLVASTAFYVCTPKEILDSNYFYSYLCSNYATQYLIDHTRGDNSPSVRSTDYEKMPLPLPPVNEQKRIAEKVKRLLSKIEKAKQLIEEAKEMFKLRQAAILDRAFRGELTRKWRIDNPNAINVNQFLEDVKSKIVNKKLKHSNVEEENLYELPNGWAWVRLGEVSNVKSSKRIFASEYADSGIPFYRSKEIGELSSLGKAKSELFISEERYAEIKEKFGVPKVGDLLLTSVGTIGNTWMCDGREFYYKDGNITQIERNEYINTEFVQLFFNSYLFKKQVNLTVSGSAYNALTIEKINQLVLPFPPLEEQQEIVRITKKILKTEEESKNILSLRENLKGLAQSILSKAFRGELGTNDPSEESAVELLKEVLQEQVN
ncbi:restriction endonuclease subunit S [Bacillus sp. FSL W8-1143]|uniref:restriction endonuclease subunit S n=1 Tax=Bacillus sp. FSL W8-1143 TaxID=2954647 RepID=UPI0030D2955E